MNKEKQGFSAFLLHFLERLNSDKTIEAKITESLTDICKYYGFTAKKSAGNTLILCKRIQICCYS